MPEKKYLEKLDAIRGFAAFYVVLHHFVTNLNFVPEIIKKSLFSFGQEAVMLFFLLSGFVICWSFSKTSKSTFKHYFLRRFRRIYFPFLIAILLSMTVFAFKGDLIREFSWEQLIGNLLMLQDFSSVKPGTWFSPYLTNYPLWSLSYEWWFYMLFFPLYKLLPKTGYRIYFILIISSLAFINYRFMPNQIALFLSYFIIWWSGVEAADIFIQQKRFTPKNMQAIIFSLLLMLMLVSTSLIGINNIRLGYYPFLMVRHFSTAFLAIVLGLLWYQRKLLFFQQTLGFFTLIAPISYGIYIFHYPILEQLDLSIYINNVWIVYIVKFVLIIALAYLIEVRLQPLVNKLIK